MSNFSTNHHGHSDVHVMHMAQILMHLHSPGFGTDLVVTNKMLLVTDHKNSSVFCVHMMYSILIHIIPLYVHLFVYGGAVDLGAWPGDLSFVAGHHRLPMSNLSTQTLMHVHPTGVL